MLAAGTGLQHVNSAMPRTHNQPVAVLPPPAHAEPQEEYLVSSIQVLPWDRHTSCRTYLQANTHPPPLSPTCPTRGPSSSTSTCYTLLTHFFLGVGVVVHHVRLRIVPLVKHIPFHLLQMRQEIVDTVLVLLPGGCG
jgi:hypothetical protein